MNRDEARRRVLASLGLTEADLTADDHGYEAARAEADRERADAWEQINRNADRVAADLNAEWKQAAGRAFDRIAAEHGVTAATTAPRCTVDNPCPAFDPAHVSLYGGCYFARPDAAPPTPPTAGPLHAWFDSTELPAVASTLKKNPPNP